MNLTNDQLLKLLDVKAKTSLLNAIKEQKAIFKGDKGETPKHRWFGTSLQFELEDGTWGKIIDLKGDKGDKGEKGKDGKSMTKAEKEEAIKYIRLAIEEEITDIYSRIEEIEGDKQIDEIIEKKLSELTEKSTPEAIRDSLMELEGAERLDAKYIKNLPEVMNNTIVAGRGIPSLNGIGGSSQTFEVTTLGTDFTITSAGTVHSFNLPTASTINRGALSSTDWTTFNNKENAITAGTTAQYWRGDKTWQTLDTLVVPENTNLYFTNARAIASTLTGYTSGAGTITSSDSIISAIQKLNGNIGALVTGVSSVNSLTGAVSLIGTANQIVVSGGTWSLASTITGLTSVTSTSFIGALTGNASTATALATARTIGIITGDATSSGSSFDGTANNTNVLTLATVNSNVGSFTNATITVNAKGLITAASSGTAPVTSVTGTLNRITVTGTTTPVIDIASTYVGQTSITTLGTITTGVWNGTAIANANLANSSISFATGSSGSDLNWSSSPVSLGGTATVNIPSMAATSVTRGLLTNTTQTIPGDKTFNSGTLTVTKTGGGDSKLVMQNSGFTGDFAFLTIGNSAVSRVGIRSESTDKATYLYAMPNGAGVLGGLNSTFSLFTTDFVADSTNISFMQMQAGVGLMGINMRNGGTGTLENFNFLFNSTVTATLTTAGLLGVGTSTGTSAPDYRLTLVGTNATTPQINLRSSRSAIVATNVIGGVIFTSNDTNLTAPGTEVASFQALATATHSASVLTTDFVWKGTNTLAYAETMRLTGEGLLGIGVTPTKGWLEIKAGTTTRSAITLTAGTNKTSPVAGDLEYDGTQIYFTNGGAVRQTIQQVQRARVASAFARTSSTTLTNITGLSVTVVAGKTYEIYAVIPTTSALSGGVKFAIGGTCTATTINYTGTTQDAAGGATYMSKSTALGGTVGEQSNVTNAETVIRGEIIVNAGGTLTVQFGQNTSNASASTCTVGGQFVVTQIA